VANVRGIGTLVASRSEVTFGTVSVGQTASATVSLLNESSAPLEITQLGLNGHSFSVAGQSDLPATISAGATYRLNVQFAPVASGAAAGQLTVSSNASTGTPVISLSGTGVANVGDIGTLVASPSEVTFGTVSVGQTASATVSLLNEGPAPLEITQLGLTGQSFSVAGQSNLPATISAGATYRLNVQFDPVAAGAAAGQLTVTDNASTGNTAVISLGGTGVANVGDIGTLVASPSQVTFGTVPVGQTASATVLLLNEGSAPLEITQLGLTGQSFSVAGQSNLPITIGAGATYRLNVQFDPVAGGAAAGQLTVTDNASTGNTAVISLGGTGTVPPTLADATITDGPGKIIPPGFLGLSHEWGVARDLAGTASKGKNLQYRQLLRNLLQYTAAPMVIRIGGNSTDTTTALPESYLESLNDLNSDLDSQFIFTLGINMGADNPTIATTEIKAISAAIPASSLLGLELGNEPDSYAAKGIRPANYNFADYLAQLTVWNNLVASASQLSPVSPALASYPWIASYENILPTKNAAPQLVTQHFYAGEYLASQPKAVDFLLAANATSGPSKLAAYIDAAHSSGKKLRIGELNSLSNGGQPGVSDAFASALWGIDIMFEFASVGADGVNWHTGNENAYDLFQFSMASSPSTGLNNYSLTQVRPLFYGLQLFEEATTSSGSLLPVTLNTQANIKVWALKGEDGKVRIVILNKDETNTGPVKLTISGYSIGTVVRLLAPSPSSETNVTLSGQTYDGSPDGNVLGKSSTESITAAGGSFTITMPSVSAALVTLSN
jgi:Abnormal spindle-like microcephaly-assoc'd, ASPM-SPD-2-Hydin/Glycosyl hydrolase family 79 C-terminal beta domain